MSSHPESPVRSESLSGVVWPQLCTVATDSTRRFSLRVLLTAVRSVTGPTFRHGPNVPAEPTAADDTDFVRPGRGISTTHSVSAPLNLGTGVRSPHSRRTPRVVSVSRSEFRLKRGRPANSYFETSQAVSVGEASGFTVLSSPASIGFRMDPAVAAIATDWTNVERVNWSPLRLIPTAGALVATTAPSRGHVGRGLRTGVLGRCTHEEPLGSSDARPKRVRPPARAVLSREGQRLPVR